jgi:ribosomal protein S18 acetylase RimI-like enzyme
MNVKYRKATASDFRRCIEIRGKTRDNPVPERVLNEFGINEETWTPQVESGKIIGVVCESENLVVGYCNGDVTTGEVLVLALLPEFENQGIGKELLARVSDILYSSGLEKLWLAAPPDPGFRAYGFYRHIGWTPTGGYDKNGDEILVRKKKK